MTEPYSQAPEGNLNGITLGKVRTQDSTVRAPDRSFPDISNLTTEILLALSHLPSTHSSSLEKYCLAEESTP